MWDSQWDNKGIKYECPIIHSCSRMWSYTGEQYEGEFRMGQMHGSGLFTWPDGQKYEGEFDNGEMHGLGKFIWWVPIFSMGNRRLGMAGVVILELLQSSILRGFYVEQQLRTVYENSFHQTNPILLKFSFANRPRPNGQKYEGTYDHGQRRGVYKFITLLLLGQYVSFAIWICLVSNNTNGISSSCGVSEHLFRVGCCNVT